MHYDLDDDRLGEKRGGGSEEPDAKGPEQPVAPFAPAPEEFGRESVEAGLGGTGRSRGIAVRQGLRLGLVRGEQ